jgi:ubiquitin C
LANRELQSVEILPEFGIAHNSVLQLIPGGELAEDYDSWVIIATPYGRVRCGVNLTETTQHFIKRLEHEVYWHPIEVIFAGQSLPTKRSLGDFGTGERSDLNVNSVDRDLIHIETKTGKLFPVSVIPGTDPKALRGIIQEHEGIPPDQQLLVFAGRELLDGTKLEDCGIGRGSRVRIVPRLR